MADEHVQIRNIESYPDSILLDAIKTVISECFRAMLIANAFAGSRSDKWDIIHNYTVDGIFNEAKRRHLQLQGIKMAVGEDTIENTWAKKYL